MYRRVFPAIVAAVLVTIAACGDSKPPTPSPGGTTGGTITGRERIGWTQAASSNTELATFRYAIYVDNVRSEVADVTCAGTTGAGGFSCSGRLPAMSSGTHVLELTSFIDSGGIIESSRSEPLRVTVIGIATGESSSLTSGETLSTVDGVRLRVEVLYEGLNNPTALAITSDGRAFVATAEGIVILRDGTALGPPQMVEGPTLALHLSPTFDRDGHLFATQAVIGASGHPTFRTSRLRDMGGWLAERMVIVENGPASAEPAASLHFGPDAKLYLAFDDGGSAERAERMSEWGGKLLRMEADGRTPDDQAAASPVLWRGLTSPRGFDWTADGSAIWIADASRDGVERLRVVRPTTERPRRASQQASYVLPGGFGAAGMAFYREKSIREFAGDLFVAGRDGGYILRIHFDPDDPSRPATTERLLENVAGSVRALAVGRDGAIYFCTASALVRLVRS